MSTSNKPLNQRLASKTPRTNQERLYRKVEVANKKMPELTGPVSSSDRIREAFYDSVREKSRKKAEDRRKVRNGSGSSHGF